MFFRYGHPIKLTFELIGVAIALALLWNHNLIWAITMYVLFSVAGTTLANRNWMSEEIGRSAVEWITLRSHPMGFVFELIGDALALVGIWNHSWLFVISGFLIVVLARLLGRHRQELTM